MRFLIAEDRPEVGVQMTKLVASAGHEASLATNGYVAVRLAAELPPDVVLLEINMPGIDGYQAARRLRKRFGRRLWIFAVTATPMDVRLAQQCGFDGIFAKPFDVKKLAALIAHLASAAPVIAPGTRGGVQRREVLELPRPGGGPCRASSGTPAARRRDQDDLRAVQLAEYLKNAQPTEPFDPDNYDDDDDFELEPAA